jgi:hypothetical protein
MFFFFLKQRRSVRQEVELELRGLRRRRSPDIEASLEDGGQLYRPSSAGVLPLSGSHGSIGSAGSYELFVAQRAAPVLQ